MVRFRLNERRRTVTSIAVDTIYAKHQEEGLLQLLECRKGCARTYLIRALRDFKARQVKHSHIYDTQTRVWLECYENGHPFQSLTSSISWKKLMPFRCRGRSNFLSHVWFLLSLYLPKVPSNSIHLLLITRITEYHWDNGKGFFFNMHEWKAMDNSVRTFCKYFGNYNGQRQTFFASNFLTWTINNVILQGWKSLDLDNAEHSLTSNMLYIPFDSYNDEIVRFGQYWKS